MRSTVRLTGQSTGQPTGQQGFSLVEMLVVVVIIAIMSTSFAWILQPSAQRQLQQAADRLSTLLELAASQSLSGEAEISWSPRPDGYDFYQLASSWPENAPEFAAPFAAPAERSEQLMDTHTPFSSRNFDDDVQISRVEINGQLMPTDQRLRFQNGLLPIYRITLQSRQQPALTQTLSGLPNGRVVLSAPSGAEQ